MRSLREMSQPLRRILHIAPFNTSGVPITFVRAERKLGFESRLITLGRDPRGYEEDVCLDLPFLDFAGTKLAKRLFSSPARMRMANTKTLPVQRPPQWRPHSPQERWLVQLRERVWRPKIEAAMEQLDFWNFDLYQLEGGLEFYRDGRTIKELKRRNKMIICLYTGSDLRTRGIIPEIDRCADLRLTLEFDHLALYPKLEHILFPFEVERYEPVPPRNSRQELVIGHAPTNRAIKGSDAIIAAVRDLMNEFPIRLLLIEGLPHHEAIQRKRECDIFIDNLGELGYGVNAIEALALGICTCTSLYDGFDSLYPDHPFVEINPRNMMAQLRRLCRDPGLRHEYARRGRAWVIRNHSAESVVRKIHGLLEPHANLIR